MKMDKCTQIQRHHLDLFIAYLSKLRATPDGDGSLLDHTILLFGSGISNSDRHTHGPLPIFPSSAAARNSEGWPPPGLPGAHAADQPAVDAVEQTRYPG